MHFRLFAGLVAQELRNDASGHGDFAEHLADVRQALAFALETEITCTRAVSALLRRPSVDPEALRLAMADLAASAELVRSCFALVREVQGNLRTFAGGNLAYGYLQ